MMATPRGLRNQNISLIDRLKSKQKQLKASLGTIVTNKAKTPVLKAKRGKAKTPKLAQGKENLHPNFLTVINVDSQCNNTSTPVPEHSHFLRKTPRSILKKRKIIDDNIKVDVPTTRSALLNVNNNNNKVQNFNNNNMLMIPSPNMSLPSTPINPSMFDFESDMTPDTERMEVDDFGPTPSKVKKNVSFNLDSGDQAGVAERRLVDPGNLRTPKSQSNSSKKKRGLFKIRKRKSPRTPLNLQRPPSNILRYDEVEQGKLRPLLGYDWIAGNLDNDPRMAGLSDNYLEELKEFRRQNRDECVGSLQPDQKMDVSRTASPLYRDPDHTCIHTYALNSRLFTVPLNANSNGESTCPICSATRRKPTSYSPGFVRVSIPQGVLRPGYVRKPHRRKSFDPSDTYALTQHCLAGWENSRPAQMPTATVVDLRQASRKQKSKQPMTLADAEEMAHSSKKKIQEMHHMNTRKSLRQISTENLLNTSYSLRQNLQRMGLNQQIGHSASDPLI